MKQHTALLGQTANSASSRAVWNRFAVRHLGSTVTMPTTGTKFIPCGQRPKESLL